MADNNELLNEAGEEVVYNNEYWGQVLISANPVYFPGGGAKPVPFDSAVHPADKRSLMIEILIDLIPECSSKFPVKMNTTSFSKDWQKIGLKSIKDCGLVTDKNGADLAKLNGMFARVGWVTGFTKNKDAEKENYRTLKFNKVFATIDECRADFEANGGPSIHTEQASNNAANIADPNKAVAIDFVRSFIKAQRSLGKDESMLKAETKKFILDNPIVSDALSADSPEIAELLEEPPF